LDQTQRGSLDYLSSHKIRSTEIRVAVIDLFLESNQAISKHDLEAKLPKLDRITLYRTLKTFEDKGLIHKVVNSHNKVKYALCIDSCGDHDHTHDDRHIHFECTKCEKTICIDEVPLPQIELPPEFVVSKVQLAVEGICQDCQ